MEQEMSGAINLLIIGAGQYGQVAREAAEAMGCFSKIEFVDDRSPLAIGTTDDLKKFRDEFSSAFVAIGDPDIRLTLIERLDRQGYTLPTLIHPRSYVSPTASVGRACIIEPFAVIQSGAVIGDGCLISAGAVVNHNATLECGCHIDCNATVGARITVKQKTKIESNQIYKEEVRDV